MKLSSVVITSTMSFGMWFGLTGCVNNSRQVVHQDLPGVGERPVQASVKMAQLTDLTRARMHERQRQYSEAREIYLQISQCHPNNTIARHRLGVVSSHLGNHDEAIDYLMQALELSPHNANILNDLGYAIYLKDDLHASEMALRQALAESPENQRAVNNLAMVLGKQGRMEESYALLQSVGSDARANDNRAPERGSSDEGQLSLDGPSPSTSDSVAVSSQELVRPVDSMPRVLSLADLVPFERCEPTTETAESTPTRSAAASPIQPPEPLKWTAAPVVKAHQDAAVAESQFEAPFSPPILKSTVRAVARQVVASEEYEPVARPASSQPALNRVARTAAGPHSQRFVAPVIR